MVRQEDTRLHTNQAPRMCFFNKEKVWPESN